MTELMANNNSLLSYTKSRPTRSQTHIRNYANPEYHTGIDLAKAYSGKVNTHLYQSRMESHILKSASRNYGKSGSKVKGDGDKDATKNNVSRGQSVQLKRAKSATHYSSQKTKFSTRAINPIKLQNNRIIPCTNPQQSPNNPSMLSQQSSSPAKQEHQRIIKSSMETREQQLQEQKMRATNLQLKSVLSMKAERVPEYSQEVQDVCNWKIQLDRQIKELKRLINAEKKHKSKVSLTCNKIMNERENVYKAYQVKAEENYHLGVAIDLTLKQIDFLTDQIAVKNKKNDQTKQAVGQTEIQVYQLKKYVQKTRMIVMGQQKDVSKLKNLVTISINNMSNSYMNINLLKGEKALLLADIDTQHAKNK